MDEQININKLYLEPDEDNLLIKAFLSGEKADLTFEQLVLKYKNRIYNLCFRYLGNYAEADDSAQEVFLKVYNGLKGFRFQSSFSTWIYRIAGNTCKNRLGSLEYRYHKKMVYLDAPLEGEDGEGKLEVKDESLSPFSEIQRMEKGRLIQEAIDSLAEDRKTVVILRDIELLSYEEIAKVTGLNMGTVKSKLSRAREELCAKLRRLI